MQGWRLSELNVLASRIERESSRAVAAAHTVTPLSADGALGPVVVLSAALSGVGGKVGLFEG